MFRVNTNTEAALSTLVDVFENLYKPQRLINCNPETSRQYRFMLTLFERHLEYEPTIGDLTEAVVCGFLNTYSEGRSPATVNKARNHLLAIWNFLAKKQMVETFPDIRPIKCFQRTPVAWDTHQVELLLNSAAALPGEVVPGISRSQFFTTLLLLAYDTGLRRGALMGLRRADVDLRRGFVLARAETQKQKADQTLTIHRQTISAIADMWEPDREMLFPFPYHVGTLYYWITKINRLAGLPHSSRDKLHRMRRTTASYVKAGGGDPTQQLGHSSPAITELYLDPIICGTNDAASLLPRPDVALPTDAKTLKEMPIENIVPETVPQEPTPPAKPADPSLTGCIKRYQTWLESCGKSAFFIAKETH